MAGLPEETRARRNGFTLKAIYMLLNPPGKHCANRLFEWTMTVALIGLGIHLIIWPNSIAVSKFQFMLDVIGSKTLCLFYLTVGSMRATALFLNGDWPSWGTRVRAFAALGAALVWLQMDVSLVMIQRAANADPSPSVWLYSALVAAELYSTYRAAADARYRR